MEDMPYRNQEAAMLLTTIEIMSFTNSEVFTNMEAMPYSNVEAMLFTNCGGHALNYHGGGHLNKAIVFQVSDQPWNQCTANRYVYTTLLR